MQVLFIRARLRADWCRSLKDKRSAVRPLLSGLRQRFNVSAAESGCQDIHNLIELSIAALAFDRAQADSVGQSLYDFIERAGEAEIVLWESEIR